MSERQPLVSVSMPVYNQEDLIVESIESVINQTYTDWELVIGDDCSTDRTYDVAREYQERYPDKIKLFRNEVNLGITGNCNEILKRCTGEYIASTAGDDVFLPEKLEKQVALMEENPECMLSYHDIEVFDHSSGKILRYWNRGKGSAKPIVGNTRDVAKALVLHGTRFMATLSVMVRRTAIPEGGHDKRIPIASDWLMWIDICASNAGTAAFIPDVLARYRKHSNSVTLESSKYISDNFVTLALVESSYPWLRDCARKRRGYEYYRDGVSQISGGECTEGRKQLLFGIKTYMWSFKCLAWVFISLARCPSAK